MFLEIYLLYEKTLKFLIEHVNSCFAEEYFNYKNHCFEFILHFVCIAIVMYIVIKIVLRNFKEIYSIVWSNLSLLNIVRMLIKFAGDIRALSAILAISVLAHFYVFGKFGNDIGRNDIFEVFNNFNFDNALLANIGDRDTNEINPDLDINDTQNVHNSMVSKNMVNAIKTLHECYANNENIPHNASIDNKKTYDEILFQINQSFEIVDKETPINALKEIYNLNVFHALSKFKEMDILTFVWNRINNKINNKNCHELKIALFNQLTDCYKDGELVCVTGRITRIIQSLECLDCENIVILIPLWAIKAQIGEYCSKYVDKFLLKCDELYKLAYNSDTRSDAQKTLVKSMIKCVKYNLEKKFNVLYIKTQSLTKDTLDELTSPYYDYIETI